MNPILQFKNKFPVNSILYNDDYFWPFIRAELMVQAKLAYANKQTKTTELKPYTSQLCHKSYIDYDTIREYKKCHNFKTLSDLKETSVDFLFFSNLNSSDLIEVEKKYYNRLIDPIYEAAKEIGTTAKVEVIKARNPNIKKTLNYIHPATPILPEHLYTSGHFNYLTFPNRFYKEWSKVITHFELEEANFSDFINWQINMINFYTNLLKKYSPKAIFIMPYFFHTPLTFAARKMGIKVVEIQHGITTGDNYIRYDNFQEIPKEGYKAIPSHFWTWGKTERDRLNKALDYHPEHKAITGGYPWLESSSRFIDEKDKKTLEHIKVKASKFKHIALISLQLNTYIPETVINLIHKTEDSVLWLIRKHPKGKAPTLGSIKRNKNIIYKNEISQISLNLLFQNISFNFTESSTAALEADYFGVRNFICSEGGYANYKEYIDSGKMSYLTEDTIEDAYEEMMAFKSSDKRPRANYIEEIDPKQVLLEILQE